MKTTDEESPVDHAVSTTVAPDTYAAYKDLIIERRGNGVLLVTLNRPQVLNAMTYAMHSELASLWRDVAKDPDTKAVVLTGAGRAFSAGNDLKQPDPSPDMVTKIMTDAMDIVYGMVNLEKPIVAAINGAAVGAGLAVALMSDITVAAEDAKLIDGHVRVGVVAGDHACLIWPLLCGMAKAKYYLLTNETLLGTEAERIGLVTMAVPGDEVLSRALAIAEKLASGPQQAIGWTKRALNHWLRQAGPIFEVSVALEMMGFFGADVAEARTAFQSGREAVFTTPGSPAE